MADCVVELFGLDLAVSYDHIFVALRQLAVLLRSALTTKEKESFRAVYCWQVRARDGGSRRATSEPTAGVRVCYFPIPSHEPLGSESKYPRARVCQRNAVCRITPALCAWCFSLWRLMGEEPHDVSSVGYRSQQAQ